MGNGEKTINIAMRLVMAAVIRNSDIITKHSLINAV